MIPSVTLNNGVAMPALGFGTWNIKGDDAVKSVRSAIDAGYRLLDTAKLYGNEREVGQAVRESGVDRKELFVTTKLWPTDFFNPQKAFDESLLKLDIGYIDLYLIHWPIPMMTKSIWQTMEKIYESKKARAIGVSNYGEDTIEKMLSYATVPPAVNQIKFSPFDYKKEVLEYCERKNIVIEAYSPLTQGSNLDDRTVVTAAKKYDRTPAQIMLRWCVQKGAVPLPKSSDPGRMRKNTQVFDFELSAEDMQTLDSLS